MAKQCCCFLVVFLLLMTARQSVEDCFDEILPKNTDEIKRDCSLVHEQMMICISEITDCLTIKQNPRICYLDYHNCIEKSPSKHERCEKYKNEVVDHVRECTIQTFVKLKNEILEKALKTLETVMSDVLGVKYTSIVPKRPDSLGSFLRLLRPFTNSPRVNGDDKLREKIVEVDKKLLSEIKIPLNFWHGGFGNNIVSRLIDRTLVKVFWDGVQMKYVNHAWAMFADCLERKNYGLCINNFNTTLKEQCDNNSDRLQCGEYIGLVAEQLNGTFSNAERLSNEKIYKVISKFKLNDFRMKEYVMREDKLPLFHREYKNVFESCYSVKRTVSSCILIFHNCEQEGDDCMDKLHECFMNITAAEPKCLNKLFVINGKTKAVRNFVDWGKENIWWIVWSLVLVVVNVLFKKAVNEVWKSLCKKLKKEKPNETTTGTGDMEMVESETPVEGTGKESNQPPTKDKEKDGDPAETMGQSVNNSNSQQLAVIETKQSSSTDNGERSAPTDALLPP